MSIRQIAYATALLSAPAKPQVAKVTDVTETADDTTKSKKNAGPTDDTRKGIAAIVVTAKRAGLDGSRLNVTVVKPDNKAGDDNPNTFVLEVRRAKDGVDAKDITPLERIPVSLKVLAAEDSPDKKAQVVVAYESRRPQTISVAVADTYRHATDNLAALLPAFSSEPIVLNIDNTKKQAPSPDEFKGYAAIDAKEDITMICVPDLVNQMHTLGKEKTDDRSIKNTIKQVQVELIALAERKRDRLVIVDPPPNLTPMEVSKWRLDQAGYDSAYAALYWPWIKLIDPVTKSEIEMPPSGHIAGIWARNDTTRGVHKAPANEVVRGITGLAYNASKGEQDTLNPDGVNCIRSFPGMGIRVWGARTLSSNPSWRYINVRRLFNFVEKSIERNTQWVVFEPNDIRLWGRIRRDVNAFLTTLWRDGMFFGVTPAEAFFVKCDAENNPEETRDQGKLIIEIGIAPSKPAEFVIFRIQQWSPSQADA